MCWAGTCDWVLDAEMRRQVGLLDEQQEQNPAKCSVYKKHQGFRREGRGEAIRLGWEEGRDSFGPGDPDLVSQDGGQGK